MILMLISAIGKCSRASNSTNNYMFLNDEQLMKGRFIGLGKRSPKFLSFNTVDDDIVVCIIFIHLIGFVKQNRISASLHILVNY